MLTALKKRLEQSTVPLFPRHRLRMLSKLAEGAFGTVLIYFYIYISINTWIYSEYHLRVLFINFFFFPHFKILINIIMEKKNS